jgi:hypothetical protein
MTGWASTGLEAAGINPLDVHRRGRSPIAFLRSQVHGLRSTGDLERTILAVEGAGVESRHFGGVDLVARLQARRGRSGSFEGQVNLTAFGILALRSAGVPSSKLRRSAAWLRGAENRDGGWGFRSNAGSDPDSTGAAVQGLASVRGPSGVGRGAGYLRRVQRRDGGFALAGASTSNAQSTAWAVQGLVAAGADPERVRARGRSPLDYLRRRQAADGHYTYSAASDQTPVWVTAQALLAVHRRAFPLASVAPATHGGNRAGAGSRPGPADHRSSNSGDRGNGTRVGGAGRRGRGGDGGAVAGPPTDRGPFGGPRRVSGQRVSAPITSREASGAGGMAEPVYVAGGFILLAAALAGGFLWYRRRLP